MLSGKRVRQLSRCSCITPPNRNGEGANSNTAQVKRNVTTSFECRSAIQWKWRESLSVSRILTCTKALRKSPAPTTGWKRLRVRTFHQNVNIH